MAAKNEAIEVDAIEPSVPRRAGVPATHLLGVSAIFVDLFGLAILVPLLPFRHTALVVATTLTAQYGAVLVGQLGWGVASDRLGRRRTLAIVMAGTRAVRGDRLRGRRRCSSPCARRRVLRAARPRHRVGVRLLDRPAAAATGATLPTSA